MHGLFRNLAAEGARFAFGDYALDVARRELRRGAHLLPVEPQVFDLLVFLIQHRDRVVSKNDLIEGIWGGRIVSESTLTSRINAVRKAIGDSGARQEMIRTLARKGFRFVAPVTEGRDVAASEQVRHYAAAAFSDHIAPAQHSADAPHSTDGLTAADRMRRQVGVLGPEIATPFRAGRRGTVGVIREAEIVSALVGDIYDAALDPALWRPVLEKIAGFVEGAAAGLLSKDSLSNIGNVYYNFGVEDRYIQLYQEKYWQFDPLAPLLFYNIGEVTSRLDYLADDEFLQSRFHKEWAQPQGFIDSANVVVEKTVTSCAILSVIRSEASGMVDDEMRRRMRLIVPHVRRAVLIGKVIELKTAEAASLADTLDGIGAGMFLVDASGRIVHANAAGHAILAADDFLRAAGGRLVASDAEADQTLRDTFAIAGDRDGVLGIKGIAVPLTARDGERFVAHVLPLTSGTRRRAGTAYAAVAALFVQKAARDAPSTPEIIAKTYKLTPAELRILLAAVEVGGVPEVAEALGIAETAVRFHLQQLFEKTGMRRQADLVELVASPAKAAPAQPPAARLTPSQQVRFCTAADGARIAYAVAGSGAPLVKAANWLSHIEYEWQSPVWSHLLHALTADYRLIRYDERGNGLSDWDVGISFEDFVRDLESVVDAAGVDKFALFGVSGGCSVSIAYALRHPERVTHLILYGGAARGRRKRGEQQAALSDALHTLMLQGWGQENPAFRQLFTSMFIPGGTAEQAQWFNDLQRNTTSPENAVRLTRAREEVDIEHLLPELHVPTLVLHRRGDALVPFEEGRRMAAAIEGARFVALEGGNHLLLEGEPATGRMLEEIANFLRS
jgi:pimeloyl-ACP methyl ester carboxylesterase/DNA-binding winged helix-turn-helix (wHTH) protein/DNA-binding CsgD family transcriptional regulator/PAS domain-containing protein